MDFDILTMSTVDRVHKVDRVLESGQCSSFTVWEDEHTVHRHSLFIIKWQGTKKQKNKKKRKNLSTQQESLHLIKYEVFGDHLFKNTSIFKCNLAVIFSM